jgi:hypothetical protein
MRFLGHIGSKEFSQSHFGAWSLKLSPQAIKDDSVMSLSALFWRPPESPRGRFLPSSESIGFEQIHPVAAKKSPP